MATVRNRGYESVIKEALEYYRESLEMLADTCTLMEDKDTHRKAMKQWARVSLAIKHLGSVNDGT